MNNNPIGIYDSGFGGLSVWRELYRALPDESLVYLGDGKNCPYGELDQATIQKYAQQAVESLLAEGCKLIVVACNTATAAAINFLRERYSHCGAGACGETCMQTDSQQEGSGAGHRASVAK